MNNVIVLEAQLHLNPSEQSVRDMLVDAYMDEEGDSPEEAEQYARAICNNSSAATLTVLATGHMLPKTEYRSAIFHRISLELKIFPPALFSVYTVWGSSHPRIMDKPVGRGHAPGTVPVAVGVLWVLRVVQQLRRDKERAEQLSAENDDGSFVDDISSDD